jgi:hypothetical protein
VLSFGSCTDFFNMRVEPSALTKKHKSELTESQLAANLSREEVVDIYPAGYMCRRTISVTLPSEVK